MIAVDILLDGLFAAVAAIGFGAISDPPVGISPSVSLPSPILVMISSCKSRKES